MYNSIQKVHEAQTSTGFGKAPSSIFPLTSSITHHPSSLYLTVISAPDAETRVAVARHLCYWPYVKFYKFQGDRHLLCCFYLGEPKDGWQLKQLYERSRQLVLLCLRQYNVTITRWKPLPADFRLYHNNQTFTRPDSALRPLLGL